MSAQKESYGPQNPHPLFQRCVELVWKGKYDECGNRREIDIAGLTMPLQNIETIDEPRSRAAAQGEIFDETSAHKDDFRNRLIWGDNKVVMASLLQEFQGAIDLIYIDPPFNVGADFKLPISIGEDKNSFSKEQSILEMVAYRDTWAHGIDSFLPMLSERLLLMRELLAEQGSIYVHCDARVNGYIRLLLDDIFGSKNFRNELIWKRSNPKNHPATNFPICTDTIFRYTKTDNRYYRQLYGEHNKSYVEANYIHEDERGKYMLLPLTSPATNRPNLTYEFKGMKKVWRWERERMQRADKQGLIVQKKPGSVPRYKKYLHESKGRTITNLWDNISSQLGRQKIGYPTQKPEELIKRICEASSEEGDIVGDFFCGSGTTLAVAEKIGRRWIGVDLGRFAIHTTRKRLIELQRELHEEKKGYRSFDVYNLGRYERQWWQREQLKGADSEHRNVVLKFFKAEPLTSSPSPLIHGRKGTAFIHVDGIDSIFNRQEAHDVAKAVKAIGGQQIRCLAWDFEMDIRQSVSAIEAELDIKIYLHRIPREIIDQQIEVPPFFEIALLQAEPVLRKDKSSTKVDIKLTNFLPSLTEVPSKELEALQKKVKIHNGFDFIDFWAIDFDWSPQNPFYHHWQDFRTNNDCALKTVSDFGFLYGKSGQHTACVKVVDVFGCDTSVTVEVKI